MAARKSASARAGWRGSKDRPSSRTGLIALAFAGTAALGAAIWGLAAVLRRAAPASAAEGETSAVPADDAASHREGIPRTGPAFRPDPTAPVPASEREALRPALVGADDAPPRDAGAEGAGQTVPQTIPQTTP